jgi:hypothetical protein
LSAIPGAPKPAPKGVFLLFPLLVGAIVGGYLYAVVPASYACIQIVPDSAQINFVDNTTVAGILVSYTNGTSSFFAVGACPQPVHQALFNAVNTIQEDPKFVSAENGSQFTIDPVNSLGPPLTAPNGSVYEALFFDRLNQSNTIYPCNLAGVFKQPLGQIEVLLPVTSNGTYAMNNKTVLSYSGNQLHFNCPSETGVQTFAKSQIPNEFNVGGFNFSLAFTGANYAMTNGTSFPGWDYVFNVNYGNFSQVVVFNWPSANALSQNAEPSPFIATPFSSYAVMRWYVANSTLYLTITTVV